MSYVTTILPDGSGEKYMDYKATLNLPQTDFPMKANLYQREPELLKRWQELDLYGMIEEAGKDKPVYMLHDGPPYANGHTHIGHALNKTLKDIVLKVKRMEGFQAPYVPGWDCHGLPIELQVEKNLGSKKHQMTKAEMRKNAVSMPKSISISERGVQASGGAGGLG